jgi:hypothetical protein
MTATQESYKNIRKNKPQKKQRQKQKQMVQIEYMAHRGSYRYPTLSP